MIRALLWLAVLGAGVYIATRYAAPQIRAWRFEDAMTQTVRLSEGAGEPEMRRALLETMPPYQGGGEMIRLVEHLPDVLPHRVSLDMNPVTRAAFAQRGML